ncbi:hypothetical protein ACFQZE_06835 [Paenibacillus sp. GCM10027627]|uniref:hypothetical protein n=1 Tax=unclassified Paenibacillus TaxID=185978 RepID=UPI0036268945
MEHLVNFTGYMIFSSLEYFSIFFLIFSFFRLYPENYKKEIAYLTFGSTFFSYILVLLKIHNYIPLPLLIMPVVIYILKKILDRKLRYAIISTVSGFIFFLSVQFIVISISIFFDISTTKTIHEPFILSSYFHQLIGSIITICIALFIKIFNGGYGFTFKKKLSSSKSRLFLIVTLTLGLLSIINFTTFLLTESSSISGTILIATASLISVLIITYFSNKMDNIEYS